MPQVMGRSARVLAVALLALSPCFVTAEPAPGTAEGTDSELPAGWAFAGGGSSLDAKDARHMISTAEEMMKNLCATPAGSALPSCKTSEASDGDGTAGIATV
eukprot:CAMPEP_0113826040 /NCGR_PEP_ID=MMETSP0328-20130328/4055_1 /TAXON_ID=39455 /ORGANISM="Alexandrium minutum" /LENGTH=101 /DNA_ID=CAMNT_0000794003 /DNA_START=78 /DNA_END=383 /DNA_ORIENTATION=+ /assembly_acc=CAM_ASM_000350